MEPDTADPKEPPGLIPGHILDTARRAHAAILVTDYWIARRQRIHLLYDPASDRQFEERELADLLEHATEHELTTLLMLPGVRRRPQPYWWVTLTAHHPHRN